MSYRTVFLNHLKGQPSRSVRWVFKITHLSSLLVTGLASAMILTACSEPVATEPAPRPVRVMPVHYQQVAAIARYTGEIRARYESPLAFQVGGKVLKRLVEVGSEVKPGQVLAILDQSDVKLDEAGVTAQLAAAKAELAQARKDLDHLVHLKDKALASQAAVDKRMDQVRVAEARVAAAAATQGTYSRRYDYAELKADHAGVITSVGAEPGEVVTAGQGIVRLARTDEKEVVFSVPENRLRDLQNASWIKVSLWAAPEREYEGRLREVSPGVDEILRTYTVKVSMPNADVTVDLGMTATAHIRSDESRPIARVPLTAMTENNGTPAVWIVDTTRNVVKPRDVNLAGYDDECAKVLSGIDEGEQVVTAGVHKLIAGQQVRLLGARP